MMNASGSVKCEENIKVLKVDEVSFNNSYWLEMQHQAKLLFLWLRNVLI